MDLKLTQIAVSKIIGVDENTITFWEKGRTVPQIKYVPGIIRFLGYNPQAIDTSTLGGKMKEYRYLRGLTKRKLAKQLQVDPSTITTWETNEFIPSPENYQKIVQCLEAEECSL
jgi:DNA-binding XRE family transcriptional regulator